MLSTKLERCSPKRYIHESHGPTTDGGMMTHRLNGVLEPQTRSAGIVSARLAAVFTLVFVSACSDTLHSVAPMTHDQVARVPVASVVPPTGMSAAEVQTRQEALREQIIAEYPADLQDTVRALMANESGGFFAAPTKRAAALLGEYYGLAQAESRARINKLAETSGAMLPVVVALDTSLSGDGATFVRRAMVSPHDIVLVSPHTNAATLASAVAALLSSRAMHGALPGRDLTVAVKHTEAPNGLFPRPQAVLAKLRSRPPQLLNGMGSYSWVRFAVGGKRGSRGAGPPLELQLC